MPKPHPSYPAEFRRRLMDLVRAGRAPESLAREFKVPAQSIRNWIRQADLDAGRRSDGLTTQEREEPNKLRREVRTLREEREILKKAAVGSTGRRNGAYDPPTRRSTRGTTRTAWDERAAATGTLEALAQG